MTDWTPCERCDGTGRVSSPIEEGRTYACSRCGGLGRVPPETPGHWWFYKPHDPKHGRATARIAHLEVHGEGLGRLTVYAEDGPVTHHEAHLTRGNWPLMNELRGYRHSPASARLLDHWSNQPAWKRGLEAMTWLAYWNLLGNRDETGEMYKLARLPWRDRMIGAARLKARLAPDEELF